MSLCIIGAGYVGLPLAIEFSKFYKVNCYDVNSDRINQLRKGIDVNKQFKKKQILKKNIIFSNNVKILENNNLFIITVPTPINKNKTPNLNMLKKASILVGKFMTKNSLVVYESTTYPGCTDDFCIPILENKSGLEFEKDFDVAYSPERVNPGDKKNTLNNITKIVGANSLSTLRKVNKLYNLICKSTYKVNSIKIAESAKVIENTQRDLNIALVNELSVLFNKLNISTNEVLKAASTKWNFHYYKPGLVGGHCISVDPYYLAFRAKKENYFTKLILSGRSFNESMAKYTSSVTTNLLKKNNLNVARSKVAILGFSFKENIPDYRNTKILDIVKEFKKKKVKIFIFDSIVNKKEIKKKYDLDVLKFSKINKNKFDAIILAVSHKIFKKNLSFYDKLYRNQKKKIFIDLKNNYSQKNFLSRDYQYFQL
jgi:UDP-N-acetyl-D-galactosamine dehydrogenase